MADHPRLSKTFARTRTPELCASLRTIESMPESKTTRLMRAWVIDELERRRPDASAAVGKAFEQAEQAKQGELCSGKPVQVDYVAVLLTAIENVEPVDAQ